MFDTQAHLNTVQAVVRTVFAPRLKRIGIDVDEFEGELLIHLLRREQRGKGYHPLEGERETADRGPKRLFGYVAYVGRSLMRDETRKALYRRARLTEMVARTPRDSSIDGHACMEAREELRSEMRRARC